jgi:hypothetical protein
VLVQLGHRYSEATVDLLQLEGAFDGIVHFRLRRPRSRICDALQTLAKSPGPKPTRCNPGLLRFAETSPKVEEVEFADPQIELACERGSQAIALAPKRARGTDSLFRLAAVANNQAESTVRRIDHCLTRSSQEPQIAQGHAFNVDRECPRDRPRCLGEARHLSAQARKAFADPLS